MTATLSVILICLLLSAFFSGMEIAFLTSNKLRIEIDKSKKGVTQALIDLFISHSGMYITTLLVGNNVVMVIYGIFMSDLLVKQFEFLHLSIGVELFVETLVSTLIILVFAEFLPKTVFRLRSNLFLKLFSVPVFLFYLLFFPLSYFSVWLGGWLLRIFTGRKLGHKEPNRAFGKVDLNNLIEEGEVNARQEEEMHEIKLFRNALDFSEVKLRECIVPRPDVVALSIDSSIEELTQLFIDTGLSRILIYKESIDDIIGYVHISTLFKDPPTIAKALSRVLIVPETMSAQRLLNLFIRDQKSVAVVVDEFGITAGIVTIEDIMEEIFGEIEDEHDHLNLKEVMISEQEYIIEGSMNLDDINDRLETDLVSEDYDSLGGFIIEHLDRLPEVGDEVCTDNGIRLIVEALDKNRVESVRMYLPEKHDADNKSELSSSESAAQTAFTEEIIHLIPISNINEHIKIPYLDLTDLDTEFLLCLSFKSYYISDNQSLAQHQSSFFLTAAITAPAANASPAIGTIGSCRVSCLHCFIIILRIFLIRIFRCFFKVRFQSQRSVNFKRKLRFI